MLTFLDKPDTCNHDTDPKTRDLSIRALH